MDAGELAPLVTEFVADLRALGHSCLTVGGYEASARHFARWLVKAELAIGNLDEGVLHRFARHRCRCPGIRRLNRVSAKYVRRARRFVEFLADRGIVQRAVRIAPLAPNQQVCEF
jgi:integrase/recombinase XerD